MRNSRSRARRSERRRSQDGDEELNPMNYISNLSDVMLILAVGIMLALILHWNVEIKTAEQAEDTKAKESVSFSDDDLQGTEQMPDDAQKMGNVYYDAATGKYYYQINESGDNGD